MIKRLSDEMIKAEFVKRFTVSGSFCDFCNQWEESAKFARDYYDAQIDKQAKTIEEIESCFEELENMVNIEYIREKISTLKNKVCDILAAGGTIKE
jgi:hypothetical protein